MPVIKQRASYAWTVEHVAAMRIGKSPDMLTFDIEFKALSGQRVRKLMKQMAQLTLKDEDFEREVIVGWHDMEREGKPWKFSQEAFDELCELYPGLRASVANAWLASVSGAVRKN
jgi:hypothetical protein